jgi:hydrogenase maturation protease
VVVHIEVRFLHPMAREIGALPKPLDTFLPNESFEIVPELQIAGKVYQTWHEAMERSIAVPAFSLGKPIEQTHDFHFPESRTSEPIRDHNGQIVAVIVRRQDAIKGKIEIATETVDEAATKLTIRILNQSEIPKSDLENQDQVIMRTMASAHTLIWAEGGECISLLDPPGAYVEAARNCKNIGLWPVLVGDQTKHEHDAMLSSPIILYDYPKIAAQSAGDLFDGTEIDEILTLRVMTMTDEEKAEMRNIDEHARRILERTETLPKDHLLQMHGVMRGVRQSNEDFFNPKDRRKTVTVNGVELKTGDRVRIHPKKRADVFDIALSGKIAIIEAIEEDVQNEIHLALVLEDDPGRELGMMRQPGHRFFYGADEVEPVVE